METASQTACQEGVSAILPAHNEEAGVEASVREVNRALATTGRPFEVLVVDDGSSDRTAERAAAAGARVIRLPENLGYGGALKHGIASARFDTLLILDADGTYPAAQAPQMLELLDGYEMVVGARTGDAVNVPLSRRPAKWLLRKLAGYLAGRPIPDLNSGLRVMRRALVERYLHLLPTGFSFTTSITLAALCNGHLVRYHPIDYRRRLGTSKIRALHALEFLLLVLRTIVYFNPLKVFLPLGGLFFVAGFAKLIQDVILGNLSETAVIGFLGGTLLCAVGLLADQIAHLPPAGGRR